MSKNDNLSKIIIMSKTIFLSGWNFCEIQILWTKRVLVLRERVGVYIWVDSPSRVNISTISAGLRDPTTPADLNHWTIKYLYYRRILDTRLLEPAPVANLHLLLFLPANVILQCRSILTHQTLKSLFHRRLLNKKILEPAPGKPPAASKPVLVARYLPTATIFET